jgi:S1-C subfamily serine protease
MSPVLLVGGGLGALAIITAGVVTVILATQSSPTTSPEPSGGQQLVAENKAGKEGQAQAAKVESPKTPAQGVAQIPTADALKEQLRETKDAPKQPAPETAKSPVPEQFKETASEKTKPPIQEQPKEPVKERPKPPAKDPPKEPAKEQPKEPPPAKIAGGNGQLDAAVLKKIKEATVYFRVTQADGAISQGSGFFGLAPGLVLTNAHVLGMLSPDSRRPARVEIVYRSGLPGSRTFVADILGVDRSSDLALLRVTGDGLPTPLDVRSAKDLVETQTVYIIGYPFGDSLGKNVTISTSSVSSLRTDALGTLRKVQVNGGMHPGNSGGPVVNSGGEVVGVAVSGIRATQINFAVPGDFVHVVVNGRVTGAGYGQAYRDGDKVKVPVTFEMLDPLGKTTRPAVQLWTGNPGNARPPSATEPAPLPGDSEVTTVELAYDGKGQARGEIVLPPLPPGKVFWQRPSYVNAAGKKVWVTASVYRPTPAVDRVPAALVLRQEAGRRDLDLDSHATLRLLLPDSEPHSLKISMKTRLAEQVQPSASPQGLTAVTLTYQDYKMGVSVDGKNAPRDARLQRIISNIRQLGARLTLDQQGNIRNNQVFTGRMAPDVREDLLDLHGQIGDSLEAINIPVPNRTLQPKETWTSVRRLPIQVGKGVERAVLVLTYTYLGVATLNGRKVALLDINGQVHGPKGGERRIGGRANGRAGFDLERGQVTMSHITVVADLDMVLKGEKIRASGTLETRLNRSFPVAVDLASGRDVLPPTIVPLSPAEPLDRVNKQSHHRVFRVAMTAGQTYVIDMKAQGPGKFDPYLRLEDPDGKEVARDDDSGGGDNGLDARIVYRAPRAGTYSVICTTFQPRQTGRFLISVKELAPRK